MWLAAQGFVGGEVDVVGGGGQVGVQAFEVAAVGGDDEDGDVAEPADFVGEARGFAASAFAEDDLRAVAVFDGVGGGGLQFAVLLLADAAQACVEVMLALRGVAAVVEEALVVGVACGVVGGEVQVEVA